MVQKLSFDTPFNIYIKSVTERYHVLFERNLHPLLTLIHKTKYHPYPLLLYKNGVQSQLNVTQILHLPANSPVTNIQIKHYKCEVSGETTAETLDKS